MTSPSPLEAEQSPTDTAAQLRGWAIDVEGKRLPEHASLMRRAADVIDELVGDRQ